MGPRSVYESFGRGLMGSLSEDPKRLNKPENTISDLSPKVIFPCFFRLVGGWELSGSQRTPSPGSNK